MDFVYRILQILKALWISLSQTIYNLRNLQKQKILGSKLFPPSRCESYHRLCTQSSPSSDDSLLFDVWSENAALFKKLMKIHSNPPILYYMYDFNLFPICNSKLPGYANFKI